MKTFEIIGQGFNGSTDATDDRILWVEAPNIQVLQDAIEHAPYKDVCEIRCTVVHPEDVDYYLPDHATNLRDHLWRFTSAIDRKLP